MTGKTVALRSLYLPNIVGYKGISLLVISPTTPILVDREVHHERA